MVVYPCDNLLFTYTFKSLMRMVLVYDKFYDNFSVMEQIVQNMICGNSIVELGQFQKSCVDVWGTLTHAGKKFLPDLV